MLLQFGCRRMIVFIAVIVFNPLVYTTILHCVQFNAIFNDTYQSMQQLPTRHRARKVFRFMLQQTPLRCELGFIVINYFTRLAEPLPFFCPYTDLLISPTSNSTKKHIHFLVTDQKGLLVQKYMLPQDVTINSLKAYIPRLQPALNSTLSYLPSHITINIIEVLYQICTAHMHVFPKNSSATMTARQHSSLYISPNDRQHLAAAIDQIHTTLVSARLSLATSTKKFVEIDPQYGLMIDTIIKKYPYCKSFLAKYSHGKTKEPLFWRGGRAAKEWVRAQKSIVSTNVT